MRGTSRSTCEGATCRRESCPATVFPTVRLSSAVTRSELSGSHVTSWRGRRTLFAAHSARGRSRRKFRRVPVGTAKIFLVRPNACSMPKPMASASTVREEKKPSTYRTKTLEEALPRGSGMDLMWCHVGPQTSTRSLIGLVTAPPPRSKARADRSCSRCTCGSKGDSPVTAASDAARRLSAASTRASVSLDSSRAGLARVQSARAYAMLRLIRLN